MTNERWIEFTVQITLKINEGSFGIHFDRQGEFRFCAQSREDARAIAGHWVKGATRSFNIEKLVQIVDSNPVPWEVVELARCKQGVGQKDMTIPELAAWIEELEAELV